MPGPQPKAVVGVIVCLVLLLQQGVVAVQVRLLRLAVAAAAAEDATTTPLITAEGVEALTRATAAEAVALPHLAAAAVAVEPEVPDHLVPAITGQMVATD